MLILAIGQFPTWLQNDIQRAKTMSAFNQSFHLTPEWHPESGCWSWISINSTTWLQNGIQRVIEVLAFNQSSHLTPEWHPESECWSCLSIHPPTWLQNDILRGNAEVRYQSILPQDSRMAFRERMLKLAINQSSRLTPEWHPESECWSWLLINPPTWLQNDILRVDVEAGYQSILPPDSRMASREW
jgi:hypothetical protein